MRAVRSPQHLVVDGLGVTRFPLDPSGAETADQPVVIIVPGAMDRAGGFRRAIRHLGDLDVVAYDRRGYATSIGLGTSDDLADHVDDLIRIIDHVGAPAVVVGHSQGALIALHAAVRISTHSVDAPADLRAVRAVGAWEPPLPWFGWYDETAHPAVSDACSGGATPSEIAERFMRSVISDRLWDRLPRSMQDERLEEGPALVADIRSARRAGAVLAFDAITLPVVVGYGTDTSPQHRRSAQMVADEVAGAELVVVEGATHGVHLTHASEFARFVRTTVRAAGR